MAVMGEVNNLAPGNHRGKQAECFMGRLGHPGLSELGPIDEYKDLFENAPCGYLTIGSDGRITKVNATFTAWTGLRR